jgi:hypothetical protein
MTAQPVDEVDWNSETWGRNPVHVSEHGDLDGEHDEQSGEQ